MKVAILNILTAANGVSSNTLFRKKDYLTDQTAHNLKVDELVIEPEIVECEHIPTHLFCNVHPTLMFNHVITKQWT